MFGLFKKKDHTKELFFSLVFAKNNARGKLAMPIPIFTGKVLAKNSKEECEMTLDKISGTWFCPAIGLKVAIRKEESRYYADISEIDDPDTDSKASFAIRFYKGMTFFTIDGHGLFIEYNELNNHVILEGNIYTSLEQKVADESSQPLCLNIDRQH